MVKSNDLKHRALMALIYIVLIALALTYLYPLFFMFANSLKTQAEYMYSPFTVMIANGHWENYTGIFNNFRIQNYLRNTLFVTVAKLALSLPLAICASYAFAKLRFRGRKVLYPAVMVAMFIPFQVIMIPVYVMLSRMRLINTYTGLILMGTAMGIPGMVLLLTANFRGIPREMLEAASIDGAGYFRTVFQLVVPMGLPAISINIIMSFIGSWNDLLPPMVVIKKIDKQLIMPALNNLVGQFSKDVPYQLTGMVIASVPAILIYLLLSKYIIMGITAGSVK